MSRRARQRERLPFGAAPLRGGGQGGAFTPALLSGLVGWWRQGDVVSSAERVSQWTDSISGHHLLQATGPNQPLLIPNLGENYLWCPGVNSAANEASHASTAALRVTTAAIGAAFRVRLTDWTPASVNMLLAKGAGTTTKSYTFGVSSSGPGRLTVQYTTDGSTNVSALSTVAPTVTDNTTIWLGFWWDNPNSLCYFYTAPDSPTVPSGAGWTALGTPVALAAGSIFSDTSIVTVGRQSVGNAQTNGKIFRALLYTGTSADNTPTSATTPLLDFNPALGTDGQGSLNDAVDGGAWTIPNTAGSPAAYLAGAGRQWVVGDSTAYYMQASYTQDMPLTRFALYRPLVWGSGNTLIGGVTNTMSVQDVTGTPQVRLLNATGGTSTVSPALGATHALVAVFNGASSIIQVDTTQATGTVNAGTSGGMTILANNTGAAGFKGAQIAEIGEVNRAVSQDEINAILRYYSALGNLNLGL